MLKQLSLMAVAAAGTLIASAATPTETASALAQRVVPAIASQIDFAVIDSPVDTFAVSARNGRVLIEGNNAGSMAVGLNNYLQRQLGTHVSWYHTDPIQVPAEIVLPSEPYGARSAVDNRFFLNYCTFGYTMPYWQWPEWERFIDWMAMNGVNLPLAMTGAEKAWYLTWRQFGLDDNEIRSSFTGPGHLPWHWMNNIDHFQGPLSHTWLNNQEQLQKQIVQRERELDMRPVLPAFSGHVPAAFSTHYPDANVTGHTVWGNFPLEDRCYFLNPSDPLYAEIQKTFVAVQDSLYGTDHIYGIDPFNEVESPDWSEEFLGNTSRGIFNTLRQADPRAKWLQMTWNFYNDRKHWTKPRMKAFLEGVEGDNLISLDYFCDNVELYKTNDNYFGKPFVWCYLGNFGGNTMINGNLRDIDEKIARVVAEGGDNLCGVGGTLEGFDCNPVMHEYVLAKAWNPTMSADEWTELWASQRGGRESESVRKAWKLMTDSIYKGRTYVGNASLTNARPALKKVTGTYTSFKYHYDDENLRQALNLLLEAPDATAENRAYAFDVMNLTRQLLGNEFRSVRDTMTVAYERGNIAQVKQCAERMDSIMAGLDRLLACDPQYSLANWIESACRHGTTPAEADNYEQNARTLLSIWGYPDKKLNDYANRQWSGLINSFYRQRWAMFNEALINAMENGIPFDQDAVLAGIKQWEAGWAASKAPVTPVSSENPVAVARQLLQTLNL